MQTITELVKWKSFQKGRWFHILEAQQWTFALMRV
uniref:Uncharacterized protein n=1 Tax=Anguilla anguilla TaxID=7936 RepID=A0A0E9WAW6_ANGAN